MWHAPDGHRYQVSVAPVGMLDQETEMAIMFREIETGRVFSALVPLGCDLGDLFPDGLESLLRRADEGHSP